MQLNPRFWALAVTLLYALSGVTSLAYEVLWARMFAVQFGVSILGVIVSVAAMMAGLGLGSLLGAHYSHRFTRPLLCFAALEAGVAVYALATPSLLKFGDSGLTLLAADASLWNWFLLQGCGAIALLLIPSLAMGAAFAFILRAVAAGAVSLGRLYGFNACGGALGALLPLWLLPALGWMQALQLVAVAGVSIALLSWLAQCGASKTSHSSVHSAGQHPASVSLLLYAGIGAAALILEIGWTRLFGMILLRTEYVLAVILAVFLVGIGVGSLSAKFLSRLLPPDRLLVWLPASTALFALLTLWCFPLASAWIETAQFDSLTEALVWQALILAIVTAPVTLAFGAWLPLLNASSDNQALTGAWLYGANSVGAALGAVLAGVLLLPVIGVAGTICAAALLLLVCGMALAPTRPVTQNPAQTAVLLAGLVALAWPVRNLPPVQRLQPQQQAGATDLYRYEDAVSINHVIEREDGQRILLTDLQRMDASSDPVSVAAQQNQGRLPLLLHPAPHSVLFLGVGTAISLAGSLPFPELERHAVELSQGAIIAAKTWFAPVNGKVLSQVNVTRDDARRFLVADTRHYDVIVGDLFHPDLAGHSSLLSVQQFARARQRLADDGVFVQWLALNQFDAPSLAIVLRSFRQVFPQAVLFMDGFRLALVGPESRLIGAPAVIANLQRLSASAREGATGAEDTATWLGRYWGKIPATAGVVQDEWAPQIEFDLPRARYSGDLDLGGLLNTLLEMRPDLPQAAAELHIAPADRDAFERAYSATELAARGWLATLQGNEDATRLMRLANQANPHDRWISYALADSMYATLPQALAQGIGEQAALLRILQVYPDHAEVLRALWQLEGAAGNEQQAAIYRTRLEQVSPLDSQLRAETPHRSD